MLKIRPFKGTFFNPQVVGDLSKVISPPYDVIDERRRGELLALSPYNVVRLILPLEPGESFWNRSAAIFRAWKAEEVLVTDTEPGFYLHRQTFSSPLGGTITRTGVIAALRCVPLGDSVLPHEKTFPRVRSERLNLLRACRANFSQIFTIFRDPDEEVLGILEEAAGGPPFLEFQDDEGVEHRLWRIGPFAGAEELARAVTERRLIIADGHHRYETALAFSREARVSGGSPGPADFVSVTMVRSEDPGLLVLPVHRVLDATLPTLLELEEYLAPYFEASILATGAGSGRVSLAEAIVDAPGPAFVVATREGVMRFDLRPEVEPHKVIPGEGSVYWKGLDITILHALVLERCLGMNADEMAEQGRLRYTPWENLALQAVERGEASAAFLVRPTRVEDIWRIAEGGERMPHKSSYFHPKLPSGLVIFDHRTAFD
ncbi:MAG: DUF1015 family protein [Actinomycetota bacterium]